MSIEEQADDMSRQATPRVAAHVPPTTAIRDAPPSPRRLSRRVLLACALGFGALVSLALLNGLSERPRRQRSAQEETQALAAPTPPERIRAAPAQYDPSQLAPPIRDQDYFWGGHEPEAASDAPQAAGPQITSHQGSSEGFSRAAATTPNAIDSAADAAQASPLLFTTRGRVRAPARADLDEATLAARYQAPRSAYVIQAGATLSAALLTEVDSDQPGRVIAQVSEDVYDSVSGVYLLIPQGARLIGAYDSDTQHGQQRLNVAWSRLIMPNGWSMALGAMPGADGRGAAGLSGEVDAHAGRIAAMSLDSALLGVAANQSEDDNRLTQGVGDAAAQQAAQTGGRIVDRALDVRPTLRIHAGARMRVLVTQDIVLRPYRR